jgi:hypothetical protein
MHRLSIFCAALALLSGCGSEPPPSASEQGAAPSGATSAPPPPVATTEIPGGAMTKAELAQQVCFFTPDEIAANLGFTVSAGKASTAQLEGYGMADCIYSGSDNDLRVTAYWIDPAQIAPARQGMTRLSGGGRTEVLAGDPDSAYLHDQQDNGTSLHYLRRNLRIQLHASSGRTPFAEIKPKLLALRRVP